MTAKCIIYTRRDGGVSVVHPAQGLSIEDVLTRSIPDDAADVNVVDKSSIPKSRVTRDSWKQKNGVILTGKNK